MSERGVAVLDTPHALLAYTDAHDLRKPHSIAHVIAATDNEEQAHWMWAEAVDLAAKGRLAIYHPDTGWQLSLAVLSVRPQGHEHIKQALFGSTAMVLYRGKGIKKRRDALRAWGLKNGYHGQVGGWVYRDANPTHPIGQGWDVLDRFREDRSPRQARVCGINATYRVVQGPLLTPAEKSRTLVAAAIS